MRVAIDARPLSHPGHGGYRTYLKALIQGLREREGAEELLLYVDRPLPPDLVLPASAQVRVLSPNRLKTDFGMFQRQVRRDRPDIVHGTQNYLPPGIKAPTVLTLYDALLLRPQPWDRQRRLRQRASHRYYAVMARRSAGTATRLLTISRGAASEIVCALAIPPSRLSVVYLGIALPPPRPGIRRDTRSVLAFAAPDPRKNLDALFVALSRHADRFGPGGAPRLSLVCTAARAAPRAPQGATLLFGLDDGALADVYAQAAVFAWPSRREGFGLPPLEALFCGCPVASSNAVPMPEILGDAPLYFDPDRPEELADALAALLVQAPEERAARVAKGRERAARFTCRAMADGTAAVWAEAAG